MKIPFIIKDSKTGETIEVVEYEISDKFLEANKNNPPGTITNTYAAICSDGKNCPFCGEEKQILIKQMCDMRVPICQDCSNNILFLLIPLLKRPLND